MARESTTVMSQFLADPAPPVVQKAPENAKKGRKVEPDEKLNRVPPKKRKAEPVDIPRFDTVDPLLPLRRALLWCCISDIVHSTDVNKWEKRHRLVSYLNHAMDTITQRTVWSDPLYPYYVAWALLRALAAGSGIDCRVFASTVARITDKKLEESSMRLISPLVCFVLNEHLSVCLAELQSVTEEPITDEIAALGTMMIMTIGLRHRQMLSSDLKEACISSALMLCRGIRDRIVSSQEVSRAISLLGWDVETRYKADELRQKMVSQICGTNKQ